MSKQEVHKRDQGRCFYCDTELTFEESTIEHLLATVHGGSNNNYNLAIACKAHNHEAGAKSIVEKVKIREGFLFKKVAAPKKTVLTIGDVKIEITESK